MLSGLDIVLEPFLSISLSMLIVVDGAAESYGG